MQIVTYVFSVITVVLGLFEPYCKKMKTVLIFSLMGNALVCVNYLITKSYSGSAICFVAIIELIINYTFTSRDRIIPKWIIAINTVVFLAINFITFRTYYDIFALIASMLFVFSISQSTAKYYRILTISNTLVWIFYDFLARSYANLATHIILAIATIGSFIYRDVIEKDTVPQQ